MLIIGVAAFFIPSEMPNPVMHLDKQTNPWHKHIGN